MSMIGNVDWESCRRGCGGQRATRSTSTSMNKSQRWVRHCRLDVNATGHTAPMRNAGSQVCSYLAAVQVHFARGTCSAATAGCKNLRSIQRARKARSERSAGAVASDGASKKLGLRKAAILDSLASSLPRRLSLSHPIHPLPPRTPGAALGVLCVLGGGRGWFWHVSSLAHACSWNARTS